MVACSNEGPVDQPVVPCLNDTVQSSTQHQKDFISNRPRTKACRTLKKNNFCSYDLHRPTVQPIQPGDCELKLHFC